MRLYNSINSFCDSYSIPINDSTIGYLQFFSEFTIPNTTDILTIDCFIADTTDILTITKPLNIIAQYIGDNTYRMLIQGFNNIPKSYRFRFKILVSTELGTTEFYSDLFSYEKCDNSYPIIPCLVDGQQYSSYGAFLGEITGNIVYQSWHTHESKKYTPVVFLRNVSFNKKTSTIEYKKLNNKPLKSTLKKNYNLICEPVSSIYSEYVMDIFGFGKVNLLGNTFAFDSYSDEIIDEKDCCSLYKITATAYKETQLRLQCSNNCVVLEPIDCNDVSVMEQNIPIHVKSNELVAGFTKDITQLVLDATGYDISELEFINGIDNDCWKIEYTGTQVLLVYAPIDPNGSCETLLISYSICDKLQTIYIQVIVDPCIVSTIESITYSGINPIGYTINGQFNTEVTLQYSTDNITWNDAGVFPVGTSIFTNSLPINIDLYVRVKATCDESLISNTILYQTVVVDFSTANVVQTIYRRDSGSQGMGQTKIKNLQVSTNNGSLITKIDVRCRFRRIYDNIWVDTTETYILPTPTTSINLSHQWVYSFMDPSKYMGVNWNGGDNFLCEVKIYTSLGEHKTGSSPYSQEWYYNYPDSIIL